MVQASCDLPVTVDRLSVASQSLSSEDVPRAMAAFDDFAFAFDFGFGFDVGAGSSGIKFA